MMKSHEAMKEAAGEQRDSMVPEIALRLHLKPSTVYKWTQPYEDPTDSGQRGPLETLKQYMESCLVLGRPRSAALAPLRNLNQHFHQVVFDIPEHLKLMSPDQLSQALIRCMKEVGDVVRAHEKSMADERMSKKDLRELKPEVWEAVTQLLVYLHCAKEAGENYVQR